MNNSRINLTAKEILEYDFKVDARGYRPQEVDKLLDLIIRDYTEFGNIIKTRDKQLRDLTEENYALKAELRKMQEKIDAQKVENDNRANTVTNLDLLKRISQLEKIVYGDNS